MDWGKVLQGVGALIEAIGLGTLAYGISETRTLFTSQPSLLERTVRRVLRGARRILGLKPKSRTLEFKAAGGSGAGGEVTASRGFGWRGTLEDRVARLQQLVQEHEDAIAEVRRALRGEARNRRAAVRELEQQLAEFRQETHDRIADVAAGGLSRETLGLVLFVVGLTLQTMGSMAF